MIKHEKLKYDENASVRAFISRYEEIIDKLVKANNDFEERIKKLESDLKIAQKDIHDLKYDGL
jgi:peptidoglycan hydrolase CwlO-like protein